MALRPLQPAAESLAQDDPDTASGRARVLVADAHPAERVGVRLALERHGLEVCAEAADAGAAVAAAVRERPDVCLVDAALPGDGIAAAAEIRSKLPLTSVVVTSGAPTQAGLFEALRAGAAGYLAKDTNPERLPDIVRGVMSGEAALPRRLVATLMDEFRLRGNRRSLEVPHGRAVELTAREWDVLELLRDDLSTGQIAKRLFISPVTVRTHVAALLRKLGVRDRESAARLLR